MGFVLIWQRLARNYPAPGFNPVVEQGHGLDLDRRDFAVNALALELPLGEIPLQRSEQSGCLISMAAKSTWLAVRLFYMAQASR